MASTIQLRRGSKANFINNTIVLAIGELGYCTDTKEMYIGNGISNTLIGLTILDEDTLSSDSNVSVPTQQSVKAYVDNHTVVSHTDTDATGAQLDTLTDGSNADSLHSHDQYALELIADGAITIGDTVFLNDDGTVSEFSTKTGSEYVFNSASTAVVSVTALTDTTFVIAYSDVSNSSYGTAIVATVSDSTITYGSEYVFNSGSTTAINAISLSSSKFVIGYQDTGNSNYGTAIIGTVSGTVITFGSEYVFNSASTTYVNVESLSDTKFVISYVDIGNSNYGTAIIGTVSGTVITYGSEYVFNSASTTYVGVVSLTSSKFVIAYRDSGNSSYGTAIIGTVSGTVITFGSEYVFNSATTNFCHIAMLTDTTFVIAYSDAGNSNYGTAIIGSVDGTVITYGSEYVYNSDATDTIAISSLSDTKFAVTFSQDTTHYGTLYIGTVSSTTISYGSAYVYNSASTSDISIVSLTATSFAISYNDNGNSNYGTALVGNTYNTESFIGIAQETVSDSASVAINTNRTVDANQSSLTNGSEYYIQHNGSLGLTQTHVKAGVAVSTSSIFLELNAHIGTGRGGHRSNQAFFESDIHITHDYNITNGRNAMTAGPTTVDDDVTVTIPSGSAWTIV